jgi:hypothetical protein
MAGKVISPRFAQHLNETIMTEPKSSEHHAKAVGGNTYRGSASPNGGVWAVAGRTAYRDEFQPDYGPDPDERLDSNESGHEF